MIKIGELNHFDLNQSTLSPWQGHIYVSPFPHSRFPPIVPSAPSVLCALIPRYLFLTCMAEVLCTPVSSSPPHARSFVCPLPPFPSPWQGLYVCLYSPPPLFALFPSPHIPVSPILPTTTSCQGLYILPFPTLFFVSGKLHIQGAKRLNSIGKIARAEIRVVILEGVNVVLWLKY